MQQNAMGRARVTETTTRLSRMRVIQMLLGVVWLFDGVLQLQPSMFAPSFVTDTLVPTADGNPRPIASAIVAVSRFIEPHIAIWNVSFALLQLLIGLGLLFRRTVRTALAASFVWSILVWILAEGLGGILTGTASPLSGAPGAVLLYILVGLLVWPRPEVSTLAHPRGQVPGDTCPDGGGLPVNGEPQPPSPLLSDGFVGGTGARIVWGVLWVGSAVLLLQPVNMTAGAITRLLLAAKADQPSGYAHLLSEVGAVLAPYSAQLTLLAAAVMVVVGLGVAFGWAVRPLVAVAVAIAVMIWVFPEGLGGILTGSGTDPNTGPLLVLLALYIYWGTWENATTSSSPGAE